MNDTDNGPVTIRSLDLEIAKFELELQSHQMRREYYRSQLDIESTAASAIEQRIIQLRTQRREKV
jgi:hypothetical protein